MSDEKTYICGVCKAEWKGDEESDCPACSSLAPAQCSAAGVELIETFSLKCEIKGAVDTEVIADFLCRLANQITHGQTSGAANTTSGLIVKWAVKRALNQTQPNVRVSSAENQK